jgi:hypothetical protein
MKHYEKTIIPQQVKEVLASTTCDLCKEKIETKECWAIQDVEIQCRTGMSYPEGGFGECTEVDLCPDCFNSKLLPWLRSQGAEPHQREWDC